MSHDLDEWYSPEAIEERRVAATLRQLDAVMRTLDGFSSKDVSSWLGFSRSRLYQILGGNGSAATRKVMTILLAVREVA